MRAISLRDIEEHTNQVTKLVLHVLVRAWGKFNKLSKHGAAFGKISLLLGGTEALAHVILRVSERTRTK